MFESLDMMLLKAKMKAGQYMSELIHEEKGASDFVAILVIIVILIAVAMVFRDGLEGLISTVFGKVSEWVNNTDTAH